MADDIDIEALLEEAYSRKDLPRKDQSSKDSGKKHGDKRSRSRSKSDSKSRHRHRSRSTSRGGDKRRHHGSSRDRDRDRKAIRRTPSPPSNRIPLSELEPLTEDERDARTVFMRQLAKSVRPRDIEEFFRPVGRIRDVRMITDRNSHRSKGIAYVEFAMIDSVSSALRMSGEKILNQPVLIQPTMSEKNRAAMEAAALAKQQGPTKLYVGSLHPNITEPMLRAIFEPFGAIDSVQLQFDSTTGNSKGFGFVHFKDHDNANHAMEKLNGFVLAGKAMKVGHVAERADLSTTLFDGEEAEKGGIGMNAAARSLLMQKLAANHGIDDMISSGPKVPTSQSVSAPVLSSCMILPNMFDPAKERGNDWAKEIEDDIRKEVSHYATLSHIHVDKVNPEGNIYLRFTNNEGATNVMSKLKGRLYAGRTINPSILPNSVYQSMFPNV